MDSKKEGKIFATVLHLEEYARRAKLHISEVQGFKMAKQPKQSIKLLGLDLAGLEKDITYIKEVLNTHDCQEVKT